MTDFHLPSHTMTSDGNLRGVGFELEYAGVDLQTSVKLLESLLDCKASTEGAFRYNLETGKAGKYRVEVDAALLQEGSYKEYLTAVGIDTGDLELERKIDDLIENLASVVVPCEIVTPPLPINNMLVMEDIVEGLRKHKALGTGKSLLYAFGLHINPEAVCLEAEYLLNHMRAFSLLYDWICRDSKVDFSRKLSSYIKPYPADWLRSIINPDYAPTLDDLVSDYMEGVGSRNHALDMLPLLAMHDEDKVLARAREPDLVNKRPAFHYRLANSSVDKPHWQVADEWNYWVLIEQLAHDDQLLARLGRDYLDNNQASRFKPGAFWARHVATVLEQEGA